MVERLPTADAPSSVTICAHALVKCMVMTHHKSRPLPTPQGAAISGPPPTAIPYDYAAVFRLTGVPGNVLQDVISISAEGVFVAVAVGYGYQQDRSRELPLGLSTAGAPGDITLRELPVSALIEGVRINPRSENLVFRGDAEDASQDLNREYSTQPLPVELLDKALELMLPAQNISFLFSVVDSGSGRELQDQPTHNLASLGTSTGERPFRQLARPLTFLPRSTIRVQIIERTPDAIGNLFVVLYGYKVLLGSACGESMARAIASSAKAQSAVASGNSRVIPFDYVAKFTLTGRPNNIVEDEVTVNVEGGYAATAIGYGMAVENTSVTIKRNDAGPVIPTGTDPAFALGSLPLRALDSNALSAGIRVRPEYLRIVFEAGGNLSTNIQLSVAQKAFEQLNRPEDVSFLYSISDTGAGRDWQNRPLHNIAGLGIANGLRPFKKFAWPRLFPPRSTIRVSVEEHFGRGTLFLAFQGYKLLAGSRGRS
jgi:hypothetical protein